MKILAIDPGVTTGIAIHMVYSDDVNEEWEQLELGPDKHHLALYQLLRSENPNIIVCERFDYRNVKLDGVEMPGIRLESREYIGVVELYVQGMADGPVEAPCELVMSPTSNKGKNALISPDKLKGLGLYRAPSGRQHMNDATAHLLHHVVTKLGRADYLAPLRPTPGR